MRKSLLVCALFMIAGCQVNHTATTPKVVTKTVYLPTPNGPIKPNPLNIVPEPSPITLLGLGILPLGYLLVKSRKQ
jgi:hypothetical protein